MGSGEGESYDGVQWSVDVRQFLIVFAEQGSQKAADDGLMSDDEQVVLIMKPLQHGLDAL